MSEEQGAPKVGLLIGLGVLAVAALAAIFFLKASKPEPVAAPTQFSAYTAPDKSFVCQAPQGWDRVESAGGGITAGAVFKRGPAKIDITGSLGMSLMGDIAASTGNMAGIL